MLQLFVCKTHGLPAIICSILLTFAIKKTRLNITILLQRKQEGLANPTISGSIFCIKNKSGYKPNNQLLNITILCNKNRRVYRTYNQLFIITIICRKTEGFTSPTINCSILHCFARR